jgi:hypothetical protein
MTQHFTKLTVSATGWCRKCQKFTMHRVDQDRDQGRLGPCLACIERLDKLHAEAKPPAETQRSLFCV